MTGQRGDSIAADRDRLYARLGRLPSSSGPVEARPISREQRDDYVLERWVLDVGSLEEVPACFIHPLRLEEPAPAILYNHAHGGDYSLGKEELLRGRPELWCEPYAVDLASRGFCVLAIDHWNFGERRGRTESELFKELLWQGRVLWGHMVFDSLRSLDYLQSRPEVDAARIGTLGMSMGSTMAWWVAALDERIRAVVDICCLTDFRTLIEERGLDGHGIYYYVPGLLEEFETADIQKLICPRPHLSLAGNFDALTPPRGLERIDGEVKEAYRRAGASECWRLARFDVGHLETREMRDQALAFLEEHLSPDRQEDV